jgi:conjugative relaxase-like TrwC/TraI family protein
MLSPKTQTNLANAQSYFAEHLCVGDYYSEQKRVRGEWLGIGAAMLGLSGVVEQKQFVALSENRDPRTGERLTVRSKTTRLSGESELANRRVFFDFTLSPPKSVSVAALVCDDASIVEAHAAAVRTAMTELERFAATRVRLGSEHQDRGTSNIVAALFQHETSRALDPHLHTHCVVFNATHDHVEDRWKALQNSGLLVAQKYVENVYYHQLAQDLRKAGYTVVNSVRGDFELAEVPRVVCERFSKRHREIDEKTRALLASNESKADGNIADIREHIAHKDREIKLPPVPLEKLRELWSNQLTSEERTALEFPKTRTPTSEVVSISEAVDWAEEHLFERRSVVGEHEIFRHALARGRGHSFTLEALKAETANRDYLRTKDGKLSRRDVLLREWNIVELARTGVGYHAPFAISEKPSRDDLATDQQTAFSKILSSRDFVTLFRGGAGTGKSHVLRRVQDSLSVSGRVTITLAPQRQQVLDLERDGLTNCQTVSEFLQRGTLPRGSVLVVDEAGQIGGKQMHSLLSLAHEANSRIILSGDTRQHGPVEASDALRAIERYSHVRTAELNNIRRQDPERATNLREREAIATYRAAVEAASEGNLTESFEKLEALGAVVECGEAERASKLVESYLAIIKHNESAIVVSQTRAEVSDLNERIRDGLRSDGKLGNTESIFQTLVAVDLTNAQKSDTRFFPADSVAVFRATNGQQTGKVFAVVKSGVIIETNGKLRKVRTTDLDKLTICRPQALAVSEGDRLQIKANAKIRSGKRLANGEIVSVARISKDGTITLDDGRTIPPTFRQFTRGYAVTSYGSQGKTVEHVLFSDSSTHAATNAEQWYVTISRGRKSIRIFTTDKAQLVADIQRTGNRELALDVFKIPARNRVREQLLRGVKLGREFARRVCMAVATRWTPGAKRIERKSISP